MSLSIAILDREQAMRLLTKVTVGIDQSWLVHLSSITRRIRPDRVIAILFILILPVLVFYNLEINPRPWHDEGAALLLARTLAEDGIYAMRNSDGYQTFGPVQSVGPTVILPVALAYKLFGVGLLQGRVVIAIYTLATLLLFYLVGQRMFDRWTAFLGLFFLLGAPAVRIFIYGREVLGEVPGLAFFLAGFLALERGLSRSRLRWTGVAGLFFGAAILTKSQYLIMVPATLSLVAILDILYYRQGAWKSLVLVAGLALACAVAWQIWQITYYGLEMYQQNFIKLGQLVAVTTGFRFSSAVDGIRVILGTYSGHFYIFWGFPALGYLMVISINRNLSSMLLSFLYIFTLCWLVYYIFWIIPWHHYALPAMVLVALFISSLYTRLAKIAIADLKYVFASKSIFPAPHSTVFLSIGTLIGLLSLGLWMSFNLQQYISSDVLDKVGDQPVDLRNPSQQLEGPLEIKGFLEEAIREGEIIETWERELGILTNLTYHYPDQSMLVYSHAARYRGGSINYSLGESYFAQIQPAYVVVGWYARYTFIYDLDYLNTNGKLIQSIGEHGYKYDVYRLP
jgi:4-amino-4-deoxy-L-arabinose transferase-like glycosyltransferase